MASHSPTPFSQSQEESRARTTSRVPPMRTVGIIFVVLLILFIWLRFILALQIASTGRQIQIKTEELLKQERDNAARRLEVAVAESPQNMASRAYRLGYTPNTPIYLPLTQTRSDAGLESIEFPMTVTEALP